MLSPEQKAPFSGRALFSYTGPLCICPPSSGVAQSNVGLMHSSSFLLPHLHTCSCNGFVQKQERFNACDQKTMSLLPRALPLLSKTFLREARGMDREAGPACLRCKLIKLSRRGLRNTLIFIALGLLSFALPTIEFDPPLQGQKYFSVLDLCQRPEAETRKGSTGAFFDSPAVLSSMMVIPLSGCIRFTEHFLWPPPQPWFGRFVSCWWASA